MSKFISSFMLVVALATVAQPAVGGAGHADATGPDVVSFLTARATEVVKKAFPPAPAGWALVESTNDSPHPARDAAGTGAPRFSCTVTYRRIQGVREEQKKLDEAYAESRARNEEAIKPQLVELFQTQNRIALKLRRATKRRNQTEIDRLNAELDDNGRTMRALHDETDRKISGEVEPYLVRDAEATIRISVNDSDAELQGGEPVAVRRSSFARRREGEQAGPTVWKNGQTLVLLGGWKQQEQNVFRAEAEQAASPAIRTISLLFTGDKKRVKALIKETDVKALQALIE